jgi:hypothetical protein
MSNQRREFIKRGAIAALAMSVPMGATKSSLASSLMDSISGHPPLSKANFEPHLNTRFAVYSAGSKVAGMTLIEITDLKRSASRVAKLRKQPALQECFSLLFDDSQNTRLPQDAYVVKHASLGKFSFLMVPVLTKRAGRSHYEVIINRLA